MPSCSPAFVGFFWSPVLRLGRKAREDPLNSIVGLTVSLSLGDEDIQGLTEEGTKP